jgi:hypothetical protein
MNLLSSLRPEACSASMESSNANANENAVCILKGKGYESQGVRTSYVRIISLRQRTGEFFRCFREAANESKEDHPPRQRLSKAASRFKCLLMRQNVDAASDWSSIVTVTCKRRLVAQCERLRIGTLAGGSAHCILDGPVQVIFAHGV